MELVAQAYRSWSHSTTESPYQDILGFCKSADLEMVRRKSYNLTPARYVGSEEMGETDVPFDEALSHLGAMLGPLVDESARRNAGLVANMAKLLVANPAETGNLKVVDDLANVSIAALNQKIVSTVGNFAKVLFRSWFVDFDPVYAKEQGLQQFPSSIANLFPCEFEDSELGEIPKGWRVGTYAEVLEPVSARIGNVIAPEFSATVRGLEPRELRFHKQLAQAQTKNKRICKNDLVFGLSRKVLNFGLMTAEIGSVSAVYEIFRVKTNVYVPELLELYIRYHMKMHIDILKSGAREGAPIDREYLLSKELLIPDHRIQTVFSHILKGQDPRA